MKSDTCIICGVDLTIIDDDPNGQKNCKCARCRKEENHDFDLEPKAKYSRSGQRIDDDQTPNLDYLRFRVNKLKVLLDDPHPDLSC